MEGRRRRQTREERRSVFGDHGRDEFVAWHALCRQNPRSSRVKATTNNAWSVVYDIGSQKATMDVMLINARLIHHFMALSAMPESYVFIAMQLALGRR